MTKICKDCGIEKSFLDFPKHPGLVSGVRKVCKECERPKHNFRLARRKEKNPEEFARKAAEQTRKQRAKFPDRIKAQLKKATDKRRDSGKRSEEHHTMMATNLNFRLTKILRGRLRIAIKGESKAASSLELLGCSVEHLKAWLEFWMKPGMTWENYGYNGWHIDHKKPCASFDLTKPDEQRKCFHYTNLEPLWAKDNMQKGDKVNGNRF